VVLGEPGSGKTMLMVRLVLDLLQCRSPGEAVPVLMSVASWNLTTEDFHSWMTNQLLIAHPALAVSSSSNGTGGSRAEALLRAGLVIPILDGFDELLVTVRGQALAQINNQLRPGVRLVITSRTAEYLAAAHPAAGPEITLSAAAVELCPLDMSDVIAYLRQASGGPRSASRWDPVFAALTRGGALAEVFSNPLMVGLARMIYNPRPGELAGTLPDPTELCLFGGEESIKGHLLDAFIPAAYRSDHTEGSTRTRWNAQQAEGWLTFLACYLEQVVREPGFAWWDLIKASPTITSVASGTVAGIAVIIPIVSVFIFLKVALIIHFHNRFLLNYFHVNGYFQPPIFWPYYYSGYWGWVGKITLSCGAAGGIASLFVAIGPHGSGLSQSQAARWHGRDAAVGRILLGLLYATVYCLIAVVTIDFTLGWPNLSSFASAIWLATVLAVGIAAGLAAGNRRFRAATVAVLVIGAMVGVPFLLYRYPAAGYAVGFAASLAAGVAVMARGHSIDYPSRAIRWRPRRGIIGGILSAVVVTVLAGIATRQLSVALIFGIMIGLGATVIVGFERVPGDLEAAASPAGVLKRDRSATLTLSFVTAIAAALAVGLGTFLETNKLLGIYNVSSIADGIVFGLSIGPAVGFAFGFALNGYGSMWPQWVFAREVLTIRRRVPRRLIAFLSDAHERGVLRQVGPIYQFRHIELQRRLASQGRKEGRPNQSTLSPCGSGVLATTARCVD
jgi:hypothetical protein